jgi:cell shape-determining protein MreC
VGLDNKSYYDFIIINIFASLFIFIFKTTLTSPKLKDLVNKPQAKYNTIYNSLKSAGDGGKQNLGEDNTNNNNNSECTNNSNSNTSSMKDELKRYLKELNVSSNSSANSNTVNTNIEKYKYYKSS